MQDDAAGERPEDSVGSGALGFGFLTTMKQGDCG
jgi:hypothetical protein